MDTCIYHLKVSTVLSAIWSKHCYTDVLFITVPCYQQYVLYFFGAIFVGRSFFCNSKTGFGREAQKIEYVHNKNSWGKDEYVHTTKPTKKSGNIHSSKDLLNTNKSQWAMHKYRFEKLEVQKGTRRIFLWELLKRNAGYFL